MIRGPTNTRMASVRETPSAESLAQSAVSRDAATGSKHFVSVRQSILMRPIRGEMPLRSTTVLTRLRWTSKLVVDWRIHGTY
jgi:hypothetical protein